LLQASCALIQHLGGSADSQSCLSSSEGINRASFFPVEDLFLKEFHCLSIAVGIAARVDLLAACCEWKDACC